MSSVTPLFPFFLLLLLLSVTSVRLQSICSNPTLPYKTETNDDCTNFDRICLKKDDRQCNNFLNICAQCPPSNYSAIMLRDIVKMIADLNSKYSKINDKTDNIATICVIIIIVIGILLLVLLLENRFKLITKCCEYCCGNKNSGRQYQILESRKCSDYMVTKIMKSMETVMDSKADLKMSKIVKSLEEFLDSRMNSKLDYLMTLLKTTDNHKSYMTFQMEGEYQEMELHVENNDGIVNVKTRICEKLANLINFKSLKLKHNGNILDENQCLLPAVGSRVSIVHCFVDNEVLASHILVVKQRGNTNLPDLLQFRKDEKVEDIKRNLTKSLHSEKFKIFKDSNEMKDSKMIGDYVTTDYNLIRVIKCERERVVLYSMFDESERLEVEYSNVDKISSIVQTISKTFGSDSKDIILFKNSKHLIEDKYIFEYDINVNSKILFYYPMKMYEIDTTEGVEIDSGYTSDLYRGFDDATEKEIMIKFYTYSIENLLTSKVFMDELINSQELKSNRKFVTVLGVHKSKGSLNVIMENMPQGTLNILLKKAPEFSEDDIHGYLKQIMDAIKYLHDQGLPYGSLTPYNIFFDDHKNIKLSSFNVSKYYGRISKVFEINFKTTNLSESYMAPEMRMKQPFDKPVDVWSLGVLLVGFVNGGVPDVTDNETTKNVSYKLKNKVSNELQEFIQACLKYDPDQRPTIDQLINYKFYKKYE